MNKTIHKSFLLLIIILLLSSCGGKTLPAAENTEPTETETTIETAEEKEVPSETEEEYTDFDQPSSESEETESLKLTMEDILRMVQEPGPRTWEEMEGYNYTEDFSEKYYHRFYPVNDIYVFVLGLNEKDWQGREPVSAWLLNQESGTNINIHKGNLKVYLAFENGTLTSLPFKMEYPEKIWPKRRFDVSKLTQLNKKLPFFSLYRLNSTAELDAALNGQIPDSFRQYDEAFFAERSLFLFTYEASTTVDYGVKFICCEDGECCIYAAHEYDYYATTCDNLLKYTLFSMDKKDIEDFSSFEITRITYTFAPPEEG